MPGCPIICLFPNDCMFYCLCVLVSVYIPISVFLSFFMTQCSSTPMTICMLHMSLSFSVPQYLQPSVCIFHCLLVPLFVSQSIFVPQCFCMSLCLCASVSVSYCLCFPLSIYYYMFLSFRFLCFSLCTPVSLCPSSVYSSVCVCVSQVLCVPLSVYPNVCVQQYMCSKVWSHCSCVLASVYVLISVLVSMCVNCFYVSMSLCVLVVACFQMAVCILISVPASFCCVPASVYFSFTRFLCPNVHVLVSMVPIVYCGPVSPCPWSPVSPILYASLCCTSY